MIKKHIKYFIASIVALICLLPSCINMQKTNSNRSKAAPLGYHVSISSENYFSDLTDPSDFILYLLTLFYLNLDYMSF